MVGDRHLIDLLHEATEVDLKLLFAPEHGLRDMADAGEYIENSIDPVSKVPIISLYTSDRRHPTVQSLKPIDILIFDIQDIGARFYTYISTMGKAMQSAARAGIPFMVLDRPNVLGGEMVDGYILDLKYSSLVGLYEIPIIHGMTVGELAQMIKGEAMLDGLEELDLRVVKMDNWKRSMRFPATGLEWTPTSPNIPDYETAVIYPGVCLFEGTEANEGRGTTTPFKVIGFPGLDSDGIANRLNAKNIPGVSFISESYTPRSIEGMSRDPKLKNVDLNGIRIQIVDSEVVRPLEIGVHLLYETYQSLEGADKKGFLDQRWLRKLAGTERFGEALVADKDPKTILSEWEEELAIFRTQRAKYLLYD